MSEQAGERYPGSRPFQDSGLDRIIFKGRTQESRKLLQLILSEKLVVLYAKSGMGKTSLLNAGVFKPLRRKGYFPVSLRLNEPNKGLTELIYEEVEDIAIKNEVEFESGDKATLWQYFKTTEFWTKQDVLYTPVLVLDQFEEIFTLGFSEEQKTEFIIQLADLVRGTIPESLKKKLKQTKGPKYDEGAPDVKIVISMREDFLGDLEDLAVEIPNILNTRFRLNPLTLEQGKKAILEPALLENKRLQTESFSFQSDAIDEIIKFLSERKKGKEIVKSDEIEPFQLQVLCQHIEKKILPKKIFGRQKSGKTDGEITVNAGDLGGQKGMQKILLEFYHDQIKQVRLGKRRAVRKLCQKGLISPTGRRLSVEAEMIKIDYKVSKEILAGLINSRLLRVEPRLNGFYYELSHDTLVAPIRNSMRKRRRQRRLAFVSLSLLFLLMTPNTLDVMYRLVFPEKLIELDDIRESEKLIEQAEKERYRVYRKDELALAIQSPELAYRAAVTNYEKAIILNPNNPSAYKVLAVTHIKLGQDNKAVEVYRDAVNTDPEYAYIYHKLVKDLDKRTADQIYKIAANAYKKLGSLYKNKKQWSEAITNYLEAIALDSTDSQLYTSLGYVLSNQKKYDKAVEALSQAIKLDPKNTALYNSRGLAYRRLEIFELAKADYRKAISLDTNYSAPLNNLAWVLTISSKDSFETARLLSQRSLKLVPKEPVYWDTLAEIYFRMGSFPEAEAANRRAEHFDQEGKNRKSIQARARKLEQKTVAGKR